MNRKQRLEQCLHEYFSPDYLEVVDETHMHDVPADNESHFKLIIVSQKFNQQPLLQRHRSVNELLRNELKQGIHALALHTFTPEEWARKQTQNLDSPPCLGGGKNT